MRILIVDNDARIVELVSWFLEQRGFDVDRAATFGQARGHLGRDVPDLMLSDIDLGAEDGREELWSLAREGILPPTLVVSGFLSPEVLGALAGLPGLVGTLSKPFDFEVLDQRIRAAIGQAAEGRQPAARAAREGPAGGPAEGQAERPAPELSERSPGDPPGDPPEDEDGWMEIQPGGGA